MVVDLSIRNFNKINYKIENFNLYINYLWKLNRKGEFYAFSEILKNRVP